ncbi:hypothetical protein DFH08DRAFT_1082700 [Mycena albidolilacea]|uniref:Uncharacterized protein n=1 Tax=Mycena albidolilacea TaxID=1033008 RepID=A0AAD6ZT01_9AGAR|nr:hypothetical protein DFH08DRAFT_1082700 [Mycena albidolilacea]
MSWPVQVWRPKDLEYASYFQRTFWSSFTASASKADCYRVPIILERRGTNTMLHVQFRSLHNTTWIVHALNALVPYAARIEKLDIRFSECLSFRTAEALLISNPEFPALHTLHFLLTTVLWVLAHIEPPNARKVEVCIHSRKLLAKDKEQDIFGAFQTVLDGSLALSSTTFTPTTITAAVGDTVTFTRVSRNRNSITSTNFSGSVCPPPTGGVGPNGFDSGFLSDLDGSQGPG